MQQEIAFAAEGQFPAALPFLPKKLQNSQQWFPSDAEYGERT
jgi:hypothetical protein